MMQTTVPTQLNGSTEIDVKSGEIFIIQNLGRVGKTTRSKMYMTVFKNDYEHHAQIYTDSDHRFSFGNFSLRKCEVHANETERTLSINSQHRNNGLFFEVKTTEEVRDWMKSLTPSADLSNFGSDFSPFPSPLVGKKVLKRS